MTSGRKQSVSQPRSRAAIEISHGWELASTPSLRRQLIAFWAFAAVIGTVVIGATAISKIFYLRELARDRADISRRIRVQADLAGQLDRHPLFTAQQRRDAARALDLPTLADPLPDRPIVEIELPAGFVNEMEGGWAIQLQIRNGEVDSVVSINQPIRVPLDASLLNLTTGLTQALVTIAGIIYIGSLVSLFTRRFRTSHIMIVHAAIASTLIIFAGAFVLLDSAGNVVSLLAACGALCAIALALTGRSMQKSKYRPDHCPSCDYNLTGNVSGICPECGTPVENVVGPHSFGLPNA